MVDGNYVGYTTSVVDSEIVGKTVALGWVDFIDGELPDIVEIGGVTAERTSVPFYDPTGERARA